MSPSDTSTANRRQSERHVVRCEGRIEPLREGDSLGAPKEVQLLDIGRMGVCLLIGESLPVGSQWRLRLIHRGYLLAQLPVIVRFCQDHGGACHVGAQFMIEPIVLTQLGVTEQQLAHDIVEGRFFDPAAAS